MKKFKKERAIFKKAIKVLREKKYDVIDSKFPKNKKDCVSMILFKRMGAPDRLPPHFIRNAFQEDRVVSFNMIYCYCPDCFENGVRESAHDILKWAERLPECIIAYNENLQFLKSLIELNSCKNKINHSI